MAELRLPSLILASGGVLGAGGDADVSQSHDHGQLTGLYCKRYALGGGAGTVTEGRSHMKAKLSAALVAGCVLALSGGAAYAATITDIINFTASGFEAGAPVDPVIGSSPSHWTRL